QLGDVPDGNPLWATTLESVVLGMLDRSGRGVGVAARAVEIARRTGPNGLVSALAQISWNCVRSGSWQRAKAAATEGLALARELNQPIQIVEILRDLTRIEAARGDGEACRAYAAEASALAERHGLAIVREQVRASVGLLELGLGRPEEALPHLEGAALRVVELGFFDRDVTPEADLVEALVRFGRTTADDPIVQRSIERIER